MQYTHPYQKDIKKIKRRIYWPCAVTLTLCLVVLFFSFPVTYEVMGVSYLDADPSLSWPVSLLLILLFLFVNFIILALAMVPVQTALTVECDPEKYLALNQEFSKKENKASALAVGSFYLGNHQASAQYASQMLQSSNLGMRSSGYFNLARSCFFLKDSDGFTNAATVFRQMTPVFSAKPKLAPVYQKMEMALTVMEALQTGNKEVLQRYQTLAPWVANKPTEGFTHYLQALCALTLEETEQATYHLMWVTNECPKTCLATYAATHLERLKTKE